MNEWKYNIALLLMPSVLGIFICLVCVCNMILVWFTASFTSAEYKIEAANYLVNVDVVKDGNTVMGANDDRTYTFTGVWGSIQLSVDENDIIKAHT